MPTMFLNARAEIVTTIQNMGTVLHEAEGYTQKRNFREPEAKNVRPTRSSS